MGNLADGDGEIKPTDENWNYNFNLTDDTQRFDSQNSPTTLPGEKEEEDYQMQVLRRNVLLDDTLPVEDAFETQVLDLGGETQVLDYPSCFEHMDTQLIDEFNSDDERSDATEVLDCSEGLSDVDTCVQGNTVSFDVEMISRASPELEKYKTMEEGGKDCCSRLNLSNQTPIIEVRKSPKLGSVQRFTAIRAASFRASGLAARKATLEKTSGGTFSVHAENQSSEKQTVKSNVSNTQIFVEADQICDKGGHSDEVKGLIIGNTKMGSSTVRKLFPGDCLVETEMRPSMDDNNEEGNEMLQRPTSDFGMAGLSYIDSQEPGESTQENALACVDRLIEDSRVLLDEYDLGNSSKGKSILSSLAKGALSLARKNNQRGIGFESAVFDWDDRREDEGGGDIFCRRKEEFLGSKSVGKKSFTKRPKATGVLVDGCTDGKEKSNIQNPIIVHSSKMSVDSLKLNDKTASETEMAVTKNLVDDFDEEYNRTSSEGQLETVEELTVGLNTQMAAEAMEALVHGVGIANSDPDLVAGNTEVSRKGSTKTKAKRISQKKRPFIKDGDIGVSTEISRRKGDGAQTRKKPSIYSQRQFENFNFSTDGVMTRRKRTKADAKNCRIELVDQLPSKVAGPAECNILGEVGGHEGASLINTSNRKPNLIEKLAISTPVAYRTRRASVVSKLRSAESARSGGAEELNLLVQVNLCKKNEVVLGIEAAKMLDTKGKSSESQELEILKSKSTTISDGISCPKRRRSCRKLSGQCNKSYNLESLSKPSDQLVNVEKSVSMHTRSQKIAKTSSAGDLSKQRYTCSSATVCTDSSTAYANSKGEPSTQSVDKFGASKKNGIKISEDRRSSREEQPHDRMTDASLSPSAQDKVKASSVIPMALEPSKSACNSPVDVMTPVNAASPVCVGDEYLKRSCKRSLSNSFVVKQISSLYATRQAPIASPKDARKRRELATVRVLFSQHLDDDIIKQQTKIADRLKVSIASSITDATHFITDKFVRTRNMLEAIASGKPVVTHLWLENVGRANYYIDEQKYILRDMKKEKELGFNMQVSLAHACQHPLLQGRKVLITPNTKPSKEIISGLVKTVCGQAVERVGRSALKDETIPDDLLILSCEEDYEVCAPFLEKGASVYSSELLLNGIVTQKLEYPRYELFSDHVKKTRSTIWMKKGGASYTPVKKQR